MKAMLVNVDLVVRVVVKDNATEDDIIISAVDKCQKQAFDRSWFGEGVTEIEEDLECPFGSLFADNIYKEI